MNCPFLPSLFHFVPLSLALCVLATQPFFLSLNMSHSPLPQDLWFARTSTWNVLSESPKTYPCESLKPQLRFHLSRETSQSDLLPSSSYPLLPPLVTLSPLPILFSLSHSLVSTIFCICFPLHRLNSLLKLGLCPLCLPPYSQQNCVTHTISIC